MIECAHQEQQEADEAEAKRKEVEGKHAEAGMEGDVMSEMQAIAHDKSGVCGAVM